MVFLAVSHARISYHVNLGLLINYGVLSESGTGGEEEARGVVIE